MSYYQHSSNISNIILHASSICMQVEKALICIRGLLENKLGAFRAGQATSHSIGVPAECKHAHWPDVGQKGLYGHDEIQSRSSRGRVCTCEA